MATLRIYDLGEHCLTFDLRDLLDLLGPNALRADWTVSAVKFTPGGEDWFEATGKGGEQLEKLAPMDARLSGRSLSAFAKNTRQVIWGEFVGFLPKEMDGAWVTIRAIDSTFYEVTTEDRAVLDKIATSFKDVRKAESPWQP